MKINQLSPDEEILNELGRRLAKVRKQQSHSQQALADTAGIGVATLRRIEAGQDGNMQSWLRILRALNLTQSIDNLLPANFASPMADALADKKRPYRKQSAPPTRTWGDEQR